MIERRIAVKSDLWPQPDGRVRWEFTLLDGTGRHFEGLAADEAGAYEAISDAVARCFPEATEIRERRIVRVVP